MADEYNLHFERFEKVPGKGLNVHFSVRTKSDIWLTQLLGLITKELSAYECDIEWRFDLSSRGSLEVIISNLEVAKAIAEKYGNSYNFNVERLQLNLMDYIDSNAANYSMTEIICALHVVARFYERKENPYDYD